MNNCLIYLDNQASTPIDPAVRDAILPYLSEQFGNPHSHSHRYGWVAASAVRDARSKIAQLLNADDEEIVFTSGATESCNLALRGIQGLSSELNRNRIITLSTEHPAVLETAQSLSFLGFEIVVLPVESDGLLDISKLEQELNDKTLLVSVMAANNEIGVTQPLSTIGELCQNYGALFHSDATQAAGRMPIDVDSWNVDLLSISGHKIYGPKGIGALYVRSGVKLQPLITGGRQESGLRGGTLPTAQIVGFGKACELAVQKFDEDTHHISELTSYLYQELRKIYPDLRLFGHEEHRVIGNLNIGFPGYTAEEVIQISANRIAISSGSACSSATIEPSKVLLALGFDNETATTGVRLSVGRFNTSQDIDVAIETLGALKGD